MEIAGRYLNVEGTKTYYETAGDPVKPPVVCIHSAGRDNRQWHGMMEWMADDCYVIALDMPGHAKSWAVDGKRCIRDPDEFSRFIWSFMQGLQLENPIVMGCSMGGNIVFKLACDYAGKIRAIVAMEGADYSPTISQATLDLMFHPHIHQQMNNLNFSESLIGRKASEDNRDFLIWSVYQTNPFAQQADLSAYSSMDVRSDMGKVQCPVLMIRGTDDWIVTSGMVHETYSRLTGTTRKKLIELEGLGHFPHVEHPQTVAECTMAFFKEHHIV